MELPYEREITLAEAKNEFWLNFKIMPSLLT